MKRAWTLLAVYLASTLVACDAARQLSPTSGRNAASVPLQQSVRPPRGGGVFLYVVDQNQNAVSAYKINPTSGVLTPLRRSPFASGNTPLGVAADPNGNYLYVDNQSLSVSGGSISAYSINSRSGALTQVAGSPFGGQAPDSIAITPSGGYVYAPSADHNDNVSAYAIDASNGTLSAVPGMPFSSGPQPEAIVVAPSGKFVYVADTEYTENSGEISAYSVDQSTGALSQIAGSPFAAHQSPAHMAIPAQGGFLYVPNTNGNSLSVYSIDPGSGAIAEIAGSPFPAGQNPNVVAITPLDNFVYVANAGSNNISAYAISPSGGGLTQISGSPFAAGNTPEGVAIDPSGRFLYTANAGDNNISAYRIGSNGALAAITGSPFAAGTTPRIMAIAQPH